MIRNAKTGDRVRVIQYGKSFYSGTRTSTDHHGNIISRWDFSKGNTGTIVEIQYKGVRNDKRYVIEPDSPNFGTFAGFRPIDLESIKE